jgi:beta-lactamase class C
MPARYNAGLFKDTAAVLRAKGLLLITLPLALLAPVVVVAETAESATRVAVPITAGRDMDAMTRYYGRLAKRVVDEAGVVGLAIAVVHRGEVLSESGWGVTEVRGREKVDADTVFRIASLSKAFASTLTAKLVERGEMSFDTLLAEQLPAFTLKDAQVAEHLTVRDVLSHRVGLPRNAFDPLLEQDEPYPVLAARLAELPSVCQGDACYGYQNIAFSLIGDMVFAATGNFYTHEVEKRIFHPLGMFSATYGRDALEASSSWARPHVRSRGGWVAVRPKETYYRIPPAAGVNASMRDLSQWMLAQLGHRPDVLSPDVLASVHAPLIETPHETRSSPWRRERLNSAHYGLGWRVFDYQGQTLVFHGGAVQGYRGLIALLPEHDFGVVILWNCESAAPGGLLPTYLDRFLGLPEKDWLRLQRFARQRR